MNYISTRNNQINFSSEQALNYGLAPDGGLFIPRELPNFSLGDIKNLKNADYNYINQDGFISENIYIPKGQKVVVVGMLNEKTIYKKVKKRTQKE